MSESFLIPIRNIQSQGETLQINELDLFQSLITEFNLHCTLSNPLAISLKILPIDNGVLVQGKLQGSIQVVCNRCAEETVKQLDSDFERFEQFPTSDQPQSLEDETRIFIDKNQNLILDLQAILGEEFVIALPVNPLCRDDCQGLCPHCGQNLNEKHCNCQTVAQDPRLAVFRNLKIKPKST